jgi:hypothetical protein
MSRVLSRRRLRLSFWASAMATATVPGAAYAQSDWAYCAGARYVVFQPAPVAPRVARQPFYVVALGGPDVIGDTQRVELPGFTVHGMMCRDSTILIASSESTYIVHLDASERPTRRESAAFALKGLMPNELNRGMHYLGQPNTAVRSGQAQQIPLMSGSAGHTIRLEITPRDRGDSACTMDVVSRIVERDASGAEMRARKLVEGPIRRGTDYPCGPVTPARVDTASARADSVAIELIDRIERVHGRDSPLTAIALSDSARALIRGGRLVLAGRVVDRAVASVEGRVDVDASTRIYVIRTWGVWFTAGRWSSNSVKLLTLALQMLQKQAPAGPSLIRDTQYELADAYRSVHELDQAADLIDAVAADTVTGRLPAEARLARVGLLADMQLALRRYSDVQRLRAQAQDIANSGSLPGDLIQPILWTSAQAFIRAGAYDSARVIHEEQLRFERSKPGYSTWIPHLLEAIAGLDVDMGYYRRADSLYRRVLLDAESHKGTRPWTVCRYWASLLRDLGRPKDASALENFNCADTQHPAPIPPPAPVSERVNVHGLSPNQFARRADASYQGDLTTLWSQAGLPPLDPDCGECRVTKVDLPDPRVGALVEFAGNDLNRARRYMLLEPTGRVSGGVQEWKVSAFLDTVAITEWRPSPRIERSGANGWLVLTSSVTEDNGGDGESEPTYRFRREQWFDIATRALRPSLDLPLAGYETAYELSGRLSPESIARTPHPPGPGRETTVQLAPLRVEGRLTVLELRMRVTLRAGTGYGRATENNLFTLSHRMTFVRGAGGVGFAVDPARSDLSLADMHRLYDIPSTALNYDDILRLARPRLEAVAQAQNTTDRAWVRRLVSLAPESDAKRALTKLLGSASPP